MSAQPRDIKLNLWSLSWPIFVELFLVFTVFFADSYFLSQISDDVAGAVGAIFPLFGVCAMLILMMSQAATSVASQFMGGKRFEKVLPTYITILILNTVLGTLLTLAIWLTRNHLGLWMGFSAELNEYTSQYLGIIAFIWVIFGYRSVYLTVFLSRGVTYWNMRSALLLNVTNIGMNYVFLEGLWGVPKLGITGIAYSSVGSGAITALFMMWVAHVKLDIHFEWKGAYNQFQELIKPILKIGIPSALEPMCYNLAQVAISLMIVQMGGIAMSTKTFTFNILILGVAWSIAIATGTQIIIAHMVGAKRFEAANQRMYKSIYWGMAGGLLIASVTYVFSDWLFGIFTDNREIHQLGKNLLVFGFLLEPVRSLNIIISSSLKAAGDAKFPAYVASAIMLFLFIPACYLFGLHWSFGLVGIWVVTFLDEFLRSIVNYLRWKTRLWVHMGVLANEPASGEDRSFAT